MQAGRTWMVASALVVLLVAGLVVASCGGSTNEATKAPPTTLAPSATATTAGTPADVAALYAKECAGCHAELPRAPGGVNQVRGVITMGKGDMPPFSSTLSLDQIAALATYVANGGH